VRAAQTELQIVDEKIRRHLMPPLQIAAAVRSDRRPDLDRPDDLTRWIASRRVRVRSLAAETTGLR
jgi:hypothetical protein